MLLLSFFPSPWLLLALLPFPYYPINQLFFFQLLYRLRLFDIQLGAPGLTHN